MKRLAYAGALLVLVVVAGFVNDAGAQNAVDGIYACNQVKLQ